MSEVEPLLLNRAQARALLADMPDGSFDRIAKNHGIKIGNSYYWRPGDLREIVAGLEHGVQQS
jgi:hypothetical protein